MLKKNILFIALCIAGSTCAMGKPNDPKEAGRSFGYKEEVYYRGYVADNGTFIGEAKTYWDELALVSKNGGKYLICGWKDGKLQKFVFHGGRKEWDQESDCEKLKQLFKNIKNKEQIKDATSDSVGQDSDTIIQLMNSLK